MQTNTKTFKTALSTALLLAVALFAPACDVFNPNPCNPDEDLTCIDPMHPSNVTAK